ISTSITSSNTFQILIIVIAILVGVILVGIATFMIVKYRNKKNATPSEILEIPSDQQLEYRNTLSYPNTPF
ncbi:22770_t:CDS:1, partial [Entrophospora sp. SA101]